MNKIEKTGLVALVIGLYGLSYYLGLATADYFALIIYALVSIVGAIVFITSESTDKTEEEKR